MNACLGLNFVRVTNKQTSIRFVHNFIIIIYPKKEHGFDKFSTGVIRNNPRVNQNEPT